MSHILGRHVNNLFNLFNDLFNIVNSLPIFVFIPCKQSMTDVGDLHCFAPRRCGAAGERGGVNGKRRADWLQTSAGGWVVGGFGMI